MIDLATRALFTDTGALYVPPPATGMPSTSREVHEPGLFERKWETDVRAGRTVLTFAEWLKEKGWR